MNRTIGGAPRKPFEGKHSHLSGRIIGVFYQVHTELGFGFSEKVYQRALGVALRENGMRVRERLPITVHFHGLQIGQFLADMLVDNLILLELKSVRIIVEQHEAQLLNYLKATEIEVGYILNFGPSATFKRKVFDNNHKGSLYWVRKPSSSS